MKGGEATESLTGKLVNLGDKIQRSDYMEIIHILNETIKGLNTVSLLVPVLLTSGAFTYLKSLKTEEKRINEIIQSTNVKNTKGLYPMVKKLNTDYYNIIIPDGISFDRIKDLEPIISTAIKRDTLIENDNFKYSLTFPTLKEFDESYPVVLNQYNKKDLTFPIGYDLDGKMVWLNLSKQPNMLVSGITSSGKSVFTHNMILQILNSYDAEFTLLDFKAGVELITYEELANVRDFVFFPDEASTALRKVEADILARLNKIRGVRCKDYNQYNERFPQKKIKYHIVIIEELMSLNKNKEVMEILKRCLSICRSTGTYFVLTSQRFDAGTIEGAVKTNCDIRISFKLKSRTDSMIILDEIGAEQIHAKGRCLFNDNGLLRQIQCFYIDTNKLDDMISHYPKKEKTANKRIIKDIESSENNEEVKEWFN